MLLLSLSAGLLVFSQDEAPAQPQARDFTPSTTSDGTKDADEEGFASEHEITESPTFFGDAVFDSDEVPLPIAAEVRSTDEGDVVVNEASGDPFFLGFAGSDHYPPVGELLDPLVAGLDVRGLDGRPGEFTYGFVMFSKRMTDARVAELESAGLRILGFHPHYCLRVAGSVADLGAVSTLDFVRWVGVPRSEQKEHPSLRKVLSHVKGDSVELIVNVYESDLCEKSVGTPMGRITEVNPGSAPIVRDGEEVLDSLPLEWQSNGWMHDALVQLGADIRYYEPRAMCFTLSVSRQKLEAIKALDFVQFIEAVPAETTYAVHDESVAMINMDRVRNFYDGSTNSISVVGIQDSGVENSHTDLSVWGVGWDCTDVGDAWSDSSNGGTGHGTHCAGSMLGRGVTEGDHIGNAPGLANYGGTGRLFNMRRYGGTGCTWSYSATLGVFDSSYNDGTNTTPLPHLVTNSWGYYNDTNGNGAHDSADDGGIGTESQCRTLDDHIYNFDQLHINSAGNAGSTTTTETLGINAASKNALTVGSVVDYISGTVGDPGKLWTSSSRGPAGDGRWKPNVTAPGRMIRSARADDNDGYASYSGTSMSTPHVSALAASVVDHYSFVRYKPAALSALLMASAITDNNLTISTPSTSHLDTYGAGRVDGYKCHWGTGDYTYSIHNFELTSANWTFADFNVPAGTTRVVVVMNYIEAAASSGASQALVNDYDLWIDRDPIDPAGNTGEYFAQQSTLDNSEIRMINNPAEGPWRWKVYPDSATSATIKGCVVVYYIKDDLTPDATLTLSVDDAYLQPGETVNATAEVDVDAYIASSVVLDRSGSFATLQSSSSALLDGVTTDLLDSNMSGNDIVLGNVSYLTDREGTWGLSYASEGVKSITVAARSDNMVDQNESINVTVDGTDPGLVTSLTSPSHTVGAWSNDPTITWTWNTASDNLSGIDGYGIFESVSCGQPSTILDIGAVTSHVSGTYGSSTLGRYFNIRSVDRSGNWDAEHECAGPYFIDVDAPGAPTFIGGTHTPGNKSCDGNIAMAWSGSDSHSGIAGYSFLWNSSPADCPDTIVDTTNSSAATIASPGTIYLHVRAVDNAGNWADCADVLHIGPFTIVSDCDLYSNGFEAGGLAGGGWTRSSARRVVAHSASANSGLLGARLRKGGVGTGACTIGTQQSWLEAPAMDTTGWAGIDVEFDTRTVNMEACEGIDVQWYNGLNWVSTGVISSSSWSTQTVSLPAGALGNPVQRIRFITNAKGMSEYAEVDNVVIRGID